MNNPPTIEEAIAKNLNISYVEPGDNGEVVTVTLSCEEVIKLSRAYMERMRQERPEAAVRIDAEFPEGYPDRELVLDYIAVHWAKIEPEQNDD